LPISALLPHEVFFQKLGVSQCTPFFPQLRPHVSLVMWQLTFPRLNFTHTLCGSYEYIMLPPKGLLSLPAPTSQYIFDFVSKVLSPALKCLFFSCRPSETCVTRSPQRFPLFRGTQFYPTTPSARGYPTIFITLRTLRLSLLAFPTLTFFKSSTQNGELFVNVQSGHPTTLLPFESLRYPFILKSDYIFMIMSAVLFFYRFL